MSTFPSHRSLPQPEAPKYWRLAERLRRRVANGELKPGDRMPSFVELRSEEGVSRSTVEKVYSLLEQEGLISREPSRGTFVTAPRQRSLTNLIGFVGNISSPEKRAYWGHMMEGVQEVLGRAEQRLLLLDSNSPLGWDKIDGVLIFGQEPASVLRWVQPEFPYVSLLHPIEGVTSVVADEAGGARQAVEHLIGLGHRRIAHLTERIHPIAAARLTGYRDALQEAGIKPQPSWEPRFKIDFGANKFIPWGRKCMRQWIDDGWRETGCTALLAQNDEIAIGAIQTMQEAGIAVPQDVSVIGFDGTGVYDYFLPQLSSVEIPLYQIGVTGAEVLMRQIKDEHKGADNLVVSTRMRIGQSTAVAQQTS